jgi:hypothetical protein
MAVNPPFDSLRQDPRFLALVLRAKLRASV